MRDKKQRRCLEWGGDVDWYHHNTETIVSLCWDRRRKRRREENMGAWIK